MPTDAGRRDYYSVLGVGRDAQEADLKRAYKKLAMKYHPDRNQASDAKERFQEVSTAFAVLNDPEKRKIYDMYGEAGLQGGVPADHPAASGAGGGAGFRFDQAQAEDIFRQFFGGGAAGGGGMPGIFTFSTSGGRGGGGGGSGVGHGPRFAARGGNPFGGLFGEAMDSSDDEVGGGNAAFGGPGRSFRPSAAAPSSVVVEQPLPVSLEELASGFTKKLKVTKRIQDSVTGAIKTVANVLEVTGKPGWKTGTKITFPAAGDELTGQPQQDICFVVQQKPHPHFTRNGDDLVTTVRVPLVDALCGATVQVPLLNGQSQRLSLDRIAPDTVRQITGQGMPIKGGGRGNLVVKFQIVFPAQLTPEHKEGLRNFLPRT